MRTLTENMLIALELGRSQYLNGFFIQTFDKLKINLVNRKKKIKHEISMRSLVQKIMYLANSLFCGTLENTLLSFA